MSNKMKSNAIIRSFFLSFHSFHSFGSVSWLNDTNKNPSNTHGNWRSYYIFRNSPFNSDVILRDAYEWRKSFFLPEAKYEHKKISNKTKINNWRWLKRKSINGAKLHISLCIHVYLKWLFYSNQNAYLTRIAKNFIGVFFSLRLPFKHHNNISMFISLQFARSQHRKIVWW